MFQDRSNFPQEPSLEVPVAGGGGRRKSYNTGGNIFPKSARPKSRDKIAENSMETDDKVNNSVCS